MKSNKIKIADKVCNNSCHSIPRTFLDSYDVLWGRYRLRMRSIWPYIKNHMHNGK